LANSGTNNFMLLGDFVIKICAFNANVEG